MVQGGTQAISRSFFASMIPPGRTAEFFGFYDISSKFSGIFGPAVFGFITQVTGSSRLAIAVLSYTFILGIVILRKVRG
jgi:Permeases of the major facilitator superfamily